MKKFVDCEEITSDPLDSTLIRKMGVGGGGGSVLCRNDIRNLSHVCSFLQGHSAVFFVTLFASPHGRFAPSSSPVVVVCVFVLLSFIDVILITISDLLTFVDNGPFLEILHGVTFQSRGEQAL
ncbi:hypothetical protein NECAME_03749 [Necator americanus]|uniref:Uncharacterized protein n=1 Tax=Necator americanus TaxID=51031 RepID=W2T1V9_NECAM|nr:hypothetical protein NECAME_03749 [Necator americanus]ETN75559.1 hypothetical protein NECAME_03749 [Necator americanus]